MLTRRIRRIPTHNYQTSNFLDIAYGPSVTNVVGPTPNWTRNSVSYYYDSGSNIYSGTIGQPRYNAYSYNNQTSAWEPGILLEGIVTNFNNETFRSNRIIVMTPFRQVHQHLHMAM